MFDDASRKAEKCGDEEGLKGHCAVHTNLEMKDVEDEDRRTRKRLFKQRGIIKSKYLRRKPMSLYWPRGNMQGG